MEDKEGLRPSSNHPIAVIGQPTSGARPHTAQHYVECGTDFR